MMLYDAIRDTIRDTIRGAIRNAIGGAMRRKMRRNNMRGRLEALPEGILSNNVFRREQTGHQKLGSGIASVT